MTSLNPAPGHQNKLHGLDHLRALAIFLVFLFHYAIMTPGRPEWMGFFVQFGWTGVDLFFVLSGFLISSQLFAQIRERQAISFRIFFLKRVFRILPAFWVTLLLYFCFPFFREREALPPLWKFLTFTQNLSMNIRDSGTFSHAWSLCVEEHFYLFLPLILMVLQTSGRFKKSYWLLILLFLGGFAVRIYSWEYLYAPHMEEEDSWLYWYRYLYYPTYNRLDGLLAGVSMAAIYRFLPDLWTKVSKYGNLLMLAGLLTLTAAYHITYDSQSRTTVIVGFTFVAIGYGILVAGSVSPSSFLFQWKSGITTFIATLSYAIYLTHKGIIHMTQVIFLDLGVEKTGNLMLLLCTVFCVLGAWILHLVVEKPFMRLRDRVLR
ncbi:acyltransferase family protein [Emticicia sp. CRIBPO]|uniref:acyltransferase family protein n=1 Tax=Emticicia sp. CRIBPO TaxID=2683258 RepID=UPI0014124F30|nr:acyltransferase [Emticicia sp. CRIBPO]NBA88990.1 acyltransferase family protein [Emticicia sp. CRIBPO]